MNKEIIEKCGMELATEEVILLISKKIDEYEKKKDKNIIKEVANLLNDREKIYNNDNETIKKYIKI